VIIALGLAGIVNLAMLMVAAKLFHSTGNASVSTIEGRARRAQPTRRRSCCTGVRRRAVGIGVSSSSVGTLAGQVAMAGFVQIRIPLVVRRLITMLPSLAVLAVGLNSTDVLNASQVALSFGIPFALVPLIAITRDQ
jgi:manganese transport protein